MIQCLRVYTYIQVNDTYMYVYIYIYIYMHIRIYMYISTCIYLQICIHTNTHLNVQIHISFTLSHFSYQQHKSSLHPGSTNHYTPRIFPQKHANSKPVSSSVCVSQSSARGAPTMIPKRRVLRPKSYAGKSKLHCCNTRVRVGFSTSMTMRLEGIFFFAYFFFLSSAWVQSMMISHQYSMIESGEDWLVR